tara:strand:+ start:1294 stop:1719 length:426 start_codon:yes stop_codon:yes gene_type:complete
MLKNIIYMLFLFFNFITFTFNLNNLNNLDNFNNIKLPDINNKYYTKITFPLIGKQEIEYLQYKKYKSKITLKGIINENGFVSYNIKELDKFKMDQKLINIIEKYNCVIEEPLYNLDEDYISLKLYIKLIKFSKKIKLKRII